MANDSITTYCVNEDGFPKVLYAATVRLGIPEHPEYVSREFTEHGTESCERWLSTLAQVTSTWRCNPGTSPPQEVVCKTSSNLWLGKH
jgi:hypothetical protein